MWFHSSHQRYQDEAHRLGTCRERLEHRKASRGIFSVDISTLKSIYSLTNMLQLIFQR